MFHNCIKRSCCIFCNTFVIILVDFQMNAKAKVTIAAGAVVCNECELKGEVTLTKSMQYDVGRDLNLAQRSVFR